MKMTNELFNAKNENHVLKFIMSSGIENLKKAFFESVKTVKNDNNLFYEVSMEGYKIVIDYCYSEESAIEKTFSLYQYEEGFNHLIMKSTRYKEGYNLFEFRDYDRFFGVTFSYDTKKQTLKAEIGKKYFIEKKDNFNFYMFINDCHSYTDEIIDEKIKEYSELLENLYL